MCLYPIYIKNRKYEPNKKNGGIAPINWDVRVAYVPTPCGNCIECRKQIAQAWRVRLFEEIKHHNYNYFVTLTFSNESLQKISSSYNIDEVNEIATKAVRLFLERYRKRYKKSIKHWLITELGQNKTERIHLHGIIFNDKPLTNEELQELWTYGITDNGKYCNERTINYVIKYVYKLDEKHKNYKPKILCSKGIGSQYLSDYNIERHKFKGEDTITTYRAPNGREINLPTYYKNHIYNEEEREELWKLAIEKDERYICGIKVRGVQKTNKGIEEYGKLMLQKQQDNINLGYGKRTKRKEYKLTLKMLSEG